MPELKFKIRLGIAEENPPAADMPEKWADGLKANAEKINLRREEVIGSEKDFDDKLARPSNESWSPMIDPSFLSKSERTAQDIKNAHKKNLAEAFNQYQDKLDYAFEEVDGVPAKRFKDAVEASKHLWAEAVAKGTLRFTGDKVRGRGPAVLAVLWMTAHPKAEGLLPDGDEVLEDSKPYNIALDRQRTAFKAALQQKLVQAGMQILCANFEPAIIAEQNGLIKDLLNALHDPAKCTTFAYPYTPDDSYCVYVREGAKFYLEVQVWKP